jgi:hypothetical protein
MSFTGGEPGAGLAIDVNGDLYVADSGNDRIRKVTLRSLALPTQSLSLPPPDPSGIATAPLTISNNGESILQRTASVETQDRRGWLTISATTGTAPSTIEVTAKTALLAPGVYTGSIYVSSPAAVGCPATVQVTVTVTENREPPARRVMTNQTKSPNWFTPDVW